MAIYTYETNADEDAALNLELMKINGQLVSQQRPPVDLSGMWQLLIADRLKPLTQQVLQQRLQPVIEAYMSCDCPVKRQAILDAAAEAGKQ